MITAHKYLNLDYSVINISALIIEKLQKEGLLQYDELNQFVNNELGEKALGLVLYALDFLFLLNKIVYLPELDAFKLHETK
ncbi:MAG: hypothetical protein JJT94_14530 [Bernardetiaceae bacterium]|nr:hypothetical protein [Bernardetiaceae bacterium]